VKDYVTSAQLDPSRYATKPQGAPVGPRHTAEEVMLMLAEGRLPEVAPIEDPVEHQQKLQQFAQSDQFGSLSPEGVLLFKQYMIQLMVYIRQMVQQQKMMAAAQQFSQMMQQQTQQQGPQQGEAPPMQTHAPSQSEIQGANRSHEPAAAGAAA